MKKLILFLAVMLLAGCKTQTLMDGVKEEPMYIDNTNNWLVVKRNGVYHYVLWAENTQRYIYREVPYFLVGNVERLKHARHIHPDVMCKPSVAQ
jgi:hypothetical protein